MQLAIECSKWLKALSDETEAVRQQARAINDGTRVPTPAEVQALTELYRNLHDGLLFRYGQSAQYYLSHGVDLLHNALQTELRDLQTALGVLARIEAERQHREAQRWAIQRQTEEYVMRLRSEAHANQMRAHEEHNRRWSAAFNYRPTAFCTFCARPLSHWGTCGFCGWR